MREIIDKLFREIGMELWVRGVRTRGFLQFSNSKSWDSMNPIITPLGQIPGGQYLYIGPVDVSLSADDEITDGSTKYIVRRCEVYRTNEGPIYRWALCALKGKEEK